MAISSIRNKQASVGKDCEVKEMVIGVGIDEISSMDRMGIGVSRCFGGGIVNGCPRSLRWGGAIFGGNSLRGRWADPIFPRTSWFCPYESRSGFYP